MLKTTFYIFLFSCTAIFAQQSENTQPLELPNFIIEGIERLNIQSGIKQFPDKPQPYTRSELDSINSLEKQQSLLLPIKPLTSKIIDTETKDAFVKGEFGRFNSPAFEAGYGFDLGDYKFYANGGFELSGGHETNSEYSVLFAKLYTDYIAPEKFLVFGGSKTRTALLIGNRNYKLYAREQGESVNSADFTARVDVDGSYAGLQFHTGAGFETLQLTSDGKNAFDNSFNGYVNVHSKLDDFIIGGNLELDLRSVRTTAIHYTQIDGFGAYTKPNFTLKVKGGFQFANSSSEVERGGFLLAGNLEYRLNKQLTLFGEISTGLDKTTFAAQFKSNPYLSFDSPVDYTYNIAKIRGWLYFHPYEYLSITTGINFKRADRFGVYSYLDTGLFSISYEDAGIMDFFGELYYSPTEIDVFSVNFYVSHATAGSDGNTAPYIPSIKASGFYKHVWFEQFGTQIGITYIGEKYADIQNTRKIESYLNLFVNLDLRLGNNFSMFARLDNLTNSNIFIWEGYKERGLFASVGVMWQF